MERFPENLMRWTTMRRILSPTDICAAIRRIDVIEVALAIANDGWVYGE